MVSIGVTGTEVPQRGPGGRRAGRCLGTVDKRTWKFWRFKSLLIKYVVFSRLFISRHALPPRKQLEFVQILRPAMSVFVFSFSLFFLFFVHCDALNRMSVSFLSLS